MDALAYYLQNPALPPLSPHELRAVTQGAFLFREGQPAQVFYLLYRGKAQLVKQAPNGIWQSVLTLSPGSSLGLPAAFSGTSYTASAVTLSPVRVYPIAQETLQQFLSQHPHYHQPLAKQLAQTVEHYEAIIRQR